MLEWLRHRFRKSEQKTRQLEQREFNDVTVQDDAPQPASSDSFGSLFRTAIADAEQISATIKRRAQAEAEAEAARIVAQAKLEAQEVKGRAEIDAQREAGDILSAASRKAELTEVEVKEEALRFLISVGDEIEKQIMGEYKRAYSRLSASLQDLMNEGQKVEMELRGKTAKLLESRSFGLKGYEATLLGTSEAAAPPVETSAAAETELKSDTALKEKVEEAVQLQEEALEEKAEEPARPKEEALEEKVEGPVRPKERALKEKVEEAVQLQEEALEEKAEGPVRPKERALEEKAEEAVQLQEEALEEKAEGPVQLQEEALKEKVEEAVQPKERALEEKVEEPARPKERALEEKVEEPARPKEEALGEKVEEIAQPKEEALKEKVEEPVRPKEEAPVSEVGEAMEELLRQHFPEERAGGGEHKPAPLELDNETLYTGEVDLIIDSPVELKMVSRLYSYLQTIPELKILYTRGSWDRGTTITVVLEKPIPLVSIISETPGVEVAPEVLEKDDLGTGKSGLLLRGEKRTPKGIKLILKEAQPL